MKKTFCLILALFLILSSTLTGCDSETPVSDFKYSKADDFVVIDEYIGNEERVVIPEEIDGLPVTGIGTASFAGKEIKYVKIPDTVTLIWDRAFINCKKLTEVKLGDGLTEIAPEAFRDCTALEDIELPENLEEIGYGAFKFCTSLEEIHIPKSVTSMGIEVFCGDTALASVTFEDGLKTIDAYGTFIGCPIETLTIPASVEKLGEYSFVGCKSLKSVKFLGDAPKQLGKSVFDKTNDDFVIYYDKDTSGWDNTPLSEYRMEAY